MVEEEKRSAGGDTVDSEIENAKPEVPVKRKRGRPRLSEYGLTPKTPPKDPNAPKRGRGRPRIYPAGSRPQARFESTGRPRGRPRKNSLNKKPEADSADIPVREPRSLPPKKAKIEPDEVSEDGSPRSPLKVALKSVSAKLTKGDNGSGSDVEKKGRGRPKKAKTSENSVAEAKPKGKRGRPPKVAAAAAPEPMEAEEDDEN